MTPELTLNLPAETTSKAANKSRYAAATIRVLLGLSFIVFGLNGFLNFLPQPTTPLPAGATQFITALVASGYMLQLIAVTQLVVGLLLLVNHFVPLALALLAPFTVNSILFHLFLEPSGRPMAFIFLVLELYLVWIYRASYRGILTARATVDNK